MPAPPCRFCQNDLGPQGVVRAESFDPEVLLVILSSWHGMMTSVVACGNGWLSRRLYRGVASEARLVLVKVGSARRIVHDDIRRGLDWAR